MKAVQLLSYGNAQQGLTLRELAEPGQPGPGEALVQVKFAPINYNDLMVAWGVYDWKPQLPEILGNEGAGVVLQVGEGVLDLVPGTPVVLPFMARSWRERLVVKAELLTALPYDADLQQAAMVTINAVTAAMMLEDYVDLVPGDIVAYNAATSGLGHWVAGLASQKGLRTVGLVRSQQDVGRVKQSGCEIVVLDENDALDDARLLALPIKLALDGVGGSSARRLAKLLAPDGVLVTYAAASGQPSEISGQDLILKRLSVRGFFEGHPETTQRIAGTLSTIIQHLGPRGIRQPVAAVYDARDLKDAVAHAVRGGKVLLAFDDHADPARL